MPHSQPHILITVFYKAPLGGLHANVRAQALAILGAGWSCTVLCKPGPFADQLADEGITVIRDDFTDLNACALRVLDAGPYDLVHAHPFLSREVGLHVADRLGLRLLLTIHGMYDDGLPGYADRVDRVLCVSPAIRDSLVGRHPHLAERVLVLPNAVDRARFQPGAPTRRQRLVALAREVGEEADPALRHILFVCRLDTDKQFILDVVADTWSRQRESRSRDLRWWVAGDGQQRPWLERAAASLNEATGPKRVSFLGWLPEQQLAPLYASADLSVAPGRSALDCMACSRPVIAVGSKVYLGLMDQAGVLTGQYTNYGGFGGGAEAYTAGRMFDHVEQVIYDDEALDALGAFGHAFVAREHDQQIVDERLLDVYRASLQGHDMDGNDPAMSLTPDDPPGLPFADPERSGHLAPHWTLGTVGDGDVTVTDDGHLRVVYDCEPDAKFYLSNGALDFASPGRGQGFWPVSANRHYLLRVALPELRGRPEISCWIIEYDATSRIKHSITTLRSGVQELAIATSDRTESIRVALRFSGAGEATLAPLALFLRERAKPVSGPQPGRRTREPTDFASFAGQSLVIVLGPPRSGTTWLLKLLSEHPDVVAADLDNLGARTNDAVTLETNVFNPQRPFSDVQIRHMFHRLHTEHPKRVIVEKTPIHLLHTDRVKRVFPRAALVLIERDGRDVASSLVHVGRDPKAWWQGAPKTVRDAARLWKTYAQAARHCQELSHPYTLRYEDLLADPERTLTGLLDWLGLSSEGVEALVAASSAGRNIPIPGVYRQGRTGGWRQLFTAADARDFVEEAGPELRRLGYVSDDLWVRKARG